LKFQTEKYEFEFVQEGNYVLIRIKLAEGFSKMRDIVAADCEEIEQFLSDIGKWENLIKAGLNLLFHLEIVQVNEDTMSRYEGEFGPEKYEIEVKKTKDWLIVAWIYVSREERYRRWGGIENQLPVNEIYEQVRNIPKWKSFKKASRFIREVQR